MTTTVVRQGEDAKWPGELKEIRISCDDPSCDVVLTNTQIHEAGGLMKMGWSTVPRDGTLFHYCPEHAR